MHPYLRVSRSFTLFTLLLVAIFASTDAFARRENHHRSDLGQHSVCADAGLSRAAFGLCNAFCEAMDCDGDQPHASARACERVLAKFQRKAGPGALPPCLQAQSAPDTDADGVADGDDNCPTVPNADQSGAACDCPCFDHTVIDREPALLPPDACMNDAGRTQLENSSLLAEGGYFFGATALGAFNFCQVIDAATDMFLFIEAGQVDACGALMRNSLLWGGCP